MAGKEFDDDIVLDCLVGERPSRCKEEICGKCPLAEAVHSSLFFNDATLRAMVCEGEDAEQRLGFMKMIKRSRPEITEEDLNPPFLAITSYTHRGSTNGKSRPLTDDELRLGCQEFSRQIFST